jgi:beta-lactamase class D
VEYNEPWQAWQVGYEDEDGEYVFALVRDAKTKEEAQLVGIKEIKEHGFIRDQLWIE